MLAARRILAQPLFQLYVPHVHRHLVDANAYKEWAWSHHHRNFMRPWAFMSAAFLVLILRDITGLYPRITTFGKFTCAVVIIVVTTDSSSLASKIRQLRVWTHRALVMFSALQILVTWLVSFGAGSAPSQNRVCSWHLDVLTNLYVTAPTLAAADISFGGWLLFLLLHILSSTPYFALVLKYSIPLLVLKVVIIQGLALFTYVTMEKSKIRAFIKFVQQQHQQRQQRQQQHQQRQQRQQQQRQDSQLRPQNGLLSGDAVSGSAANGGVGTSNQEVHEGMDASYYIQKRADNGSPSAICTSKPEFPSNTKAKLAWSRGTLIGVGAWDGGVSQLKTVGPEADRVASPTGSRSMCTSSSSTVSSAPSGWVSACISQKLDAPLALKKYTSSLKRLQVLVKIDADIYPHMIQGDIASIFVSGLQQRCPGSFISEIAVRQGCVMLSIDVCELQELAQHSMLGDRGHDLMKAVTQEWLHASGLQRHMDHNTALTLQVGSSMLKCLWNAHARSWELESCTLLESQQEHSIMVPNVVLDYPSIPAHDQNMQSLVSLGQPNQHQQSGQQQTELQPQPQPQQLGQQQTELQPQPQPQQQQQEQRIQLHFKAYITAPSDFKLVGWQETLQTHSDVEADRDVLQLLARTHGCFLPVEVEQLGQRDLNGGQVVQVSVSLAPLMLAFECCQLKLELVKGNALLCKCSALLASRDLEPEKQELKSWAKPPRTPAQVSAFVDDLAEWLSFQSLHSKDGMCRGPGGVAAVPFSSLQGGSGRCMSKSTAPEGPRGTERSNSKVSDRLPHMNSGAVKNSAANDVHEESQAGSDSHKGQMNKSSSPAASLMLPMMATAFYPPETFLMMVEVGQDLLLHAVCWSMSSLADRILAGLLSAPLSLPFSSIATGSILSSLPSSSPPQSLLACALLSENQHMLSRVLEWGQVHGEPSFSWDSLMYGSGEDIDHWNLPHAVQDLPSPGATQPNMPSYFTLSSATAAPVAQRVLLAHQAPDAAQSAGLTTHQVPSTVTPAPPAADTGGSAPTLAPFASGGASTLVLGFGEHGDVKESHYRSWCLSSPSRLILANICCMSVLPYFWLIAAQIAYHELAESALVIALYPVPMILALLSKTPAKRERFRLWAKVAHFSIYLIFGLGLLPTVVVHKPVLTYVDLIVEVVMYRFMEQCVFMSILQIQLPAFLLERAASAMGSALLYARLGIQYPVLQAVAINVASVCVDIALDVHNRRTYVRLLKSGMLNGQTKKLQ